MHRSNLCQKKGEANYIYLFISFPSTCLVRPFISVNKLDSSHRGLFGAPSTWKALQSNRALLPCEAETEWSWVQVPVSACMSYGSWGTDKCLQIMEGG